MADPYDPRWAEDGPRLEPTNSEKADGFPCGAEGLRDKLNWLFWDIFGRFNTLYARSIATGKGISGGGDLSANRTLVTNWASGLNTIFELDNADLLNIRDVSAAAGAGEQTKSTLGDVKEWVLEGVADSSGRDLATDKGLSGGGDLTADRTFVTDWSSGLTAISALASGDLFNVRDISAASGAGAQVTTTLGDIQAFILAQASPDVLSLQARRASGVANVAMTTTYDVWPLNTIDENTISGATVDPSTFYITLPAGRYSAEFCGVANSARNHQIRLFNQTSNAQISLGLTLTYDDQEATPSSGVANFTLSAPAEISLQHRVLTSSGGATFGVKDTTVARVDAFIRIQRAKGA